MDGYLYLYISIKKRVIRGDTTNAGWRSEYSTMMFGMTFFFKSNIVVFDKLKHFVLLSQSTIKVSG